MSKNPTVKIALSTGLCTGCKNPKSVLLSCFGGSCSERCQKTVARRAERETEKARLAALETAAAEAKAEAETAAWADRLRKGYEGLGRTWSPLPSNPREARAVLLQREKFLAQQRVWDAARERRVGRR